jgi:hypothetical protein
MYLNVKNFLNCLFNRLDARVAEFDDFAGVCHDDMVMLLVKILLFIMRLVLTELVLADERTI